MLPEIGISGLIIILIAALLLFGPKRLPEIGRSLGSSMREFKDAVTNKDDEPHSTPAAPTQLPPAEPEPMSRTTAPREHDTV